MVELTTNQKGIVAETAIIHEAVKLGIIVLRPLDHARYDLVLDLPSGLLRVQVDAEGGRRHRRSFVLEPAGA
jgi:PD-(D/E)XK endonuclease